VWSPPTVMNPLLEAKQIENTRFSPLNGECRLNSSSSRFDSLLGASPKIPFAFCSKKSLVYFYVQPNIVFICSFVPVVYSRISSSTREPCSSLP
jgi:hypothetical protein